jgi:hypothetical protein
MKASLTPVLGWDFLGSRDLSVFLFVMACTYSLILIIFATVVPTPWVNRIAWLLPFKVLYLLFFANLIICEIKWVPVALKRCRKPKPPETEMDLERFRHKIAVSREPSAVNRLEKYLRRRGYKIQWSEEKNSSLLTPHSSLIFHAYRGRLSPLGNLLFHAGFLFLLTGAYAGVFNSSDRSFMLMEGEDLADSTVSFRVEKITPRYWEDKLLFTDLKADVRYPEKGAVESGVVRMAQPLSIGGSKVSINGIGFAPMYLLKDKNEVELDIGYVRMNIFPPGTEDHFQIPGYPHQIFVSFYPDYEMRDGRMASRSMNPVNPAYYVKVFRNKVPSYGGILKPGEEAYFEGLKLSFPEFKYWGQFRIVKNPGFIYIWIAFVLFGTGLVWRLLFYRREIAVVREGDALYLYGNSDYYHGLFEDRLKTLGSSQSLE